MLTSSWSSYESHLLLLFFFQPQPIDSDDDNNVDEPLFPTEADATDAALVMLKKKMNGKYTLFRVCSKKNC